MDITGPAQAFSTTVDEGADYELAYVGEQDVVGSHQGLPPHVSVDWPALTPADMTKRCMTRSRNRSSSSGSTKQVYQVP